MSAISGVMEQHEVYLSSFARLEKELAARGPRWLHRIRRDALDRFAELGFPTVRDEDWKYTSVAPLAKISFQPAGHELDAEKLQETSFWGLDGIRLVFVNGHYSRELSSPQALPDGVKAVNLAAALEADAGLLEQHLARLADYSNHPFAALNTAFLSDGAFVYIPKGVVVEKPIHLLFVSSAGGQATVSHPRTLILAGRESQASILESYAGLDHRVYFTNAVTEIVVGEGATVEHSKVQQESHQSFHIATLQVYQRRSSNFFSRSISLGGALVRNDLNVVLSAEGVDCTLDGLYLAGGRQHVDNHTVIDHTKPHGSSRELYKGILDGASTAVFNGKIFVRKDAQKTDAKQTNKNLLLSEDAVINTKPQLEIYADDVKCTHGATVGQLDEEAVFYLRSRGIGREAARNLLTYAFARDVIGRIKSQPIQARLEQLLFGRLSTDPNAKEAL